MEKNKSATTTEEEVRSKNTVVRVCRPVLWNVDGSHSSGVQN